MSEKEMNREHLTAFMKASRQIYQFDWDKPSWRRAAELYKADTGMQFDEGCTGCRKRLLDWLLNEQ